MKNFNGPIDTSIHELYSIPKKEPPIILYDSKVQDTAYISGTLAGIFEEWILSFFEDSFFSTIRINTQANYSDFKAFMRDIYKKSKPMLIIHPELKLIEDHFYNLANSSMYNNIYANQDYSHKMLYSFDILKTDKVKLHMRLNRYSIEFDVMFIEKNMMRQADLYNRIISNIRHGSKFAMEKLTLSKIPTYLIENIANINGYDYLSEEFITMINQRSNYPVIKRITPNGVPMFYFEAPILIHVDIPSMPSKDSVENIGAIEKEARVVDRFILEANLPMEFIITMDQKPKNEFVRYAEPDEVFIISPYKAHPEYKQIEDGFNLITITDVVIEKIEENIINLEELIKNIDVSVGQKIFYYLSQGFYLKDILNYKVYVNGTYEKCEITITSKELIINNPVENKVYSICIYLDTERLNNLIKEDLFTRRIGDIVEDRPNNKF